MFRQVFESWVQQQLFSTSAGSVVFPVFSCILLLPARHAGRNVVSDCCFLLLAMCRPLVIPYNEAGKGVCGVSVWLLL